MERKSPIQGEIYKHFKNKLYQIVAVAKHSETKEKLVIYQALYDDFGIYARPYDMFMSEVDHEKYKDVTQKYRFEKVGYVGEGVLTSLGSIDTVDNANSTPNANNTTNTTDAEKIAVEAVNNENADAEEETPNPDLMAFLDAETFEEKKQILIAIKPRITERLINDMALALDISIIDGDLDAKYSNLLFCVSKFDEFEVNRLR